MRSNLAAVLLLCFALTGLAPADALSVSRGSGRSVGSASVPGGKSHDVRTPTRLIPGHEPADKLQRRIAAVRKKRRFLGWNYAAEHPEEGHWSRRLSPQQSASDRTPGNVTHHQNSKQFPGAPGNAGLGFRSGLPTGFIPTAVTTGDFNGDGHMDAAISNGGDNSIYVLLGNGDNTFQVPGLLYTQGLAPVWIAAVGLRNNGILDLVVVDADSKSLEVFLGNGDGTFSSSVQYPLPQIPTFVLAADFNKDGNQDLAVGFVVDAGNVYQPQFEILLGDGLGGFSGTVVPPPLAGEYSPIPTDWIAMADLNRDGYPDLVTTVAGGFAIAYLNQAGTAFSQGPAFGINTGDPPLVVELGDVNEDGCPDAVELDIFGLLTIATGACNGRFYQGPFAAELGDYEPAARVVDIDGDGHLDIVASSVDYDIDSSGEGSEGGYLVSVLKGDGKGHFTPATTYRGGTDEFSLAVADFNGDNRSEILTVDSLENQASLYINDGTGNFDGPRGEAIGYLSGLGNAPVPNSPVLSADFNGDGKPDLLLTEFGNEGTDPSQLTVLLNDGTGKFLAPVRTPITGEDGAVYPQFLAAPFRTPAKLDVVFVNTEYPPMLAYFPGNGNGSFGTPTVFPGPYPIRVVAGDFNGDGKLDFVGLGPDAQGANLAFEVFLGHGDGTFTELPTQVFTFSNLGTMEQAFAVDLNHDGKLDLLIGYNDNQGWTTNDDLIEVLGNGDGTFQPPTTLIPHFGAVAVSDVNHDGYADLIQSRNPNVNILGNFLSPLGATVYLGAADGTFKRQPSYNLPGFWSPSMEPVLVGDFNGDGNPDFAIRYYNEGAVEPSLRVLQGNGDGTFAVSDHTYQLQGISNPIVGADFNGDGLTDLVELVGLTSSFHTISGALVPSLDIAFNSDPVIGTDGSASVILDLPAPVAEDVTLSASDPAIQLPPTVHFNAGQQVQQFAFTLGNGFNASRAIALYAQLSGETATAYGSKPNPNLKVGVAASLYFGNIPLHTITPDGSLPLILQLKSISGYSGLYSSFQCAGLPAGASCTFSNNSLQVMAGETQQIAFQIDTSSSVPLGKFPVQVSATDGFIPVEVNTTLTVGDFSLAVIPAVIPANPYGTTAIPRVGPTSSNGLSEAIALACAGLPTGTTCSPGPLSANQPNTTVALDYTSLPIGNYPFQVIGHIGGDYHQASAVLQVGDFSATLNKSSATVPAGGSASFDISLASINHYATSISVYCQLPDNRLTCSQLQPIVLKGGEHGVVQLTISASNPTAVVRPDHKANYAVLGFFLLSLTAVLRKRGAPLNLAVMVLVLSTFISCGGGSSTSVGTGTGTGGTPPANQIIKVPVIAGDLSDSNNNKPLGPIVITLQ